MLNGIVDDTLSNNNRIMTVKHPACTTNGLKFDVIKSIESKPSIIICHVATNDITNNVDTNYQVVMEKIIKKSPSSKIAISSVIKRIDRKHLDEVTALNEKLKKLTLLTMIILTNPASVRKNDI